MVDVSFLPSVLSLACRYVIRVSQPLIEATQKAGWTTTSDDDPNTGTKRNATQRKEGRWTALLWWSTTIYDRMV